MRGAGAVVGLLVAVLIGAFTYKLYFEKSAAAGGTSTPAQTIDVTGVKMDLLAIAQAERAYQAQYGSYGSTDDLVSSGAMSLRKSGRDGYTYDVNASTDSFQAVAHCVSDARPGCVNYSIDPTMTVQTAP
ncbi:MAG: hypothetical protein KGL75_13800 [Acidobacteriota bacterium]|nr:hypothetical protein [Acidobacteriota bacterium]